MLEVNLRVKAVKLQKLVEKRDEVIDKFETLLVQRGRDRKSVLTRRNSISGKLFLCIYTQEKWTGCFTHNRYSYFLKRLRGRAEESQQ